MSVEPHLVLSEQKRIRRLVEPQTVRPKKTEHRQSFFNQMAMRSSLQHEQGRQ